MFTSYFLYAICFLTILCSGHFLNFALTNFFVQIVLFILLAAIPAYRYKRMSYVDIAWPFGLMALGILNLVFAPEHTTRVLIISAIYILMGARMGLGALLLWSKGHFQKEFPRYQYQRLMWAKKGPYNENLTLQKEVFLQAAANSSFLALPLFIQGM